MDTAHAEISDSPPAADAAGVGPALPYLQTLVAAFATSPHHIQVACDPALRLDAAELAAVGVIAREAISNALAHAFPNGRDGQIWLSLSDADGRVMLGIRDNGIGIPHLDHAADSGRGRIEAAAERLGGRARLGSTFFGGAEVKVVFPRSPLRA